MKRILISIVLLLCMSGCVQDTPTNYVVNFEFNNESAMESVFVYNWDSVSDPGIPIKEGYTFAGWYSDESLVHGYDLVNPVTDNLTLYAKWEINQYTMSFFNEDGSFLIRLKRDYGFDLTSHILSAPIKEGYTFSGWYTELQSDTLTQDISLTATYKITTYKVQYIKFDGTTIYSEEFEHLDEIVDFDIPQNTCEAGNEFFGWDTVLPSIMPEHDIVVTELCLFSSAHFILDEDINVRRSGTPQVSGNYLVIYGSSYNSDEGALFIYKSNDPLYERIIPNYYYGRGMNYEVKGDLIFISYGIYVGSREMYILKLSDPNFIEVFFEGDSDYPIFSDDIQVEGDYRFFVDTENSDNQGAVFVYKISDDSYVRTIRANNSELTTHFGEKIQVEGDIIIIDSFYGVLFNAAIFIYKISDPSYERMIYNYYPEDDCEMCGWFTGSLGLPVHVHGDYIIIASEIDNSYYRRSLHIYKISDPLYERKIPEGDTSADYYHIEGDYIVIPIDGIVYLYKISDPQYQRIITRSNLEPNDSFASEVLVVGDYIVIMDSDYNDGEGAAYLYKISDPLYEELISIGCENIWADESYVYIYNEEELHVILLSEIAEVD